MPVFPTNPGGPTEPLEGSPYPAWQAAREEIGSATHMSLGQSYIDNNILGDRGGAIVPQADAIKALKAQNYDTNDVPAEGMTQGALTERMNRQSMQRQTEDDARRANLGWGSRTAASFTGGLGDPLNVVFAPLGEFALAGRGLPLAGRLVAGAGVGAGIADANAVAADRYNKAMHLGDPDLTSYDLMKQTLLGGGIGGIMHGAFGPRPAISPGRADLTLDQIYTTGERTPAWAAAHHASPDDAVSPTGAISRFQIEPGTAKQYGVTQEQLDAGLMRNETFARGVGDRIMADLHRRFPGDPEAQAIAYNAGPGVAQRFIRSGRDYRVLPDETKAYAARIMGMPMEVRQAAASSALAQAGADGDVHVEPAVDGALKDVYGGPRSALTIQDEHDAQVSSLETEAFQRAGGKDSYFTKDPALADISEKIDATPKAAPPAEVPQTEPGQFGEAKAAIDPALAEHVKRDLDDAKNFNGHVGAQGEFDPQAEKFMVGEMTAEDHQKAVEAAVRCGIGKGTL
jgi:hypothetical protein